MPANDYGRVSSIRPTNPMERAARRVWDEFGGECGNDADYCRWTGDEATVGKCYCQQRSWDYARVALKDTYPIVDAELRRTDRRAIIGTVLGMAFGFLLAVIIFYLLRGRE